MVYYVKRTTKIVLKNKNEFTMMQRNQEKQRKKHIFLCV